MKVDPVVSAYPRHCEFFVCLRRKRDRERDPVLGPVLVPKCSLTGSGCFCEVEYLACLRRVFALDYEAKHQAQIGGLPLPSRLKVVCSEDRLLPPQPSS